MKQLFVVLVAVGFAGSALAQDATPKKRKNADLAERANDHLMFQIGYDKWAGMPDSINTKGFSRSLNMYFMLDFPFKTNPKFSIGAGVGVGSSSMYFDKMSVEITGNSQNLVFKNRDTLQRYKKYKLASTYLEAPIELRFTMHPEKSDKSFKAAVGIKVGQLLNVHTKGKNLQDKDGNTINAITVKETAKKYFNNTRLAATGRIGWGNFSLYGQYQFNAFIKEGQGPDIRPFAIGITLSGL
jgi:Outer membrane protein beta-barrel domain